MNKLKRGDQKRIAEATGYSPSFVCDVFKGRAKAPADMAEHIEHVFGVDRRAWYWPNEYPNPFLDAPEPPDPPAAA